MYLTVGLLRNSKHIMLCYLNIGLNVGMVLNTWYI
jgi:hypothetical protein